MNKQTTKLLAVVMLISTAVSSLASEGTAPAQNVKLAANPASLTVPIVQSSKMTLTASDLAKYQLLSDQSQALAIGQTAGANSKTKTVLIVVGVVVVVVGVAVLVGSQSMKNRNFISGM